MLARGGVGPFAGGALPAVWPCEANEQAAARCVGDVADDPVATAAAAVGKVMAAHHLGITREASRQIGGLRSHVAHAAALSAIRTSGCRSIIWARTPGPDAAVGTNRRSLSRDALRVIRTAVAISMFSVTGGREPLSRPPTRHVLPSPPSHSSRFAAVAGSESPMLNAGNIRADEIKMPRARLNTPDGKTTEWKSQALRAYQRRTLAADALIAGCYLAGTNTRRVWRALGALFGGTAGSGAR
jgi:hypothetical protein